MANDNLTLAKKAKQDEFYTQYADIEREMRAYLDYDPDVFRNKTVLLPCDDPEWSNFTRYFAANFERHGLRKLISTSYAPSSRKDLFSADNAAETQSRGKVYLLDRDRNQDGRIDLDDLDWSSLEGDGDFRSAEVTALRDEADIIITNPPFSLFREYIAWLMEADKRFVAIANKNCITYKEVFPFIQSNRIWSGREPWSGGMWFITTDPDQADRMDGDTPMRNVPSIWLTNIEHGRRHEPIPLMTLAENLRFNRKLSGKAAYDRYDNYDAIEIPETKAIPSDHDGIMGVPITFLDKYCPEQFEIIGTSDRGGDGKIDHIKIPHPRTDAPVVNGEGMYKRIFIKAVR